MIAVYILVAVLLVASAAIGTKKYIDRNNVVIKINGNQIMDIGTALKLTGIPLIILSQGNKQYNFIVDTGSDVSHLGKNTDIEVTPVETNNKERILSSDGAYSYDCSFADVKLYYKDNLYEHMFRITDLDEAFNQIKICTGIQVHGLIGNDFLQKYQYCLDFKEMIIYARK